ncbi:hypothetical protein GGI23_002888 [Coemansia sp. RSA 2559]|nr:hypothetical protein GGI23_002888 [Coemansia sp. RSA 2559]
MYYTVCTLLFLMAAIGFPAILVALIVAGFSEFGHTNRDLSILILLSAACIYIVYFQVCLLYMKNYAGLTVDYSKRTNIGICYLPFAIYPYKPTKLDEQAESLKANYSRLMDLAAELVQVMNTQVEARNRARNQDRPLYQRRSERQLQRFPQRSART